MNMQAALILLGAGSVLLSINSILLEIRVRRLTRRLYLLNKRVLRTESASHVDTSIFRRSVSFDLDRPRVLRQQ